MSAAAAAATSSICPVPRAHDGRIPRNESAANFRTYSTYPDTKDPLCTRCSISFEVNSLKDHSALDNALLCFECSSALRTNLNTLVDKAQEEVSRQKAADLSASIQVLRLNRADEYQRCKDLMIKYQSVQTGLRCPSSSEYDDHSSVLSRAYMHLVRKNGDETLDEDTDAGRRLWDFYDIVTVGYYIKNLERVLEACQLDAFSTISSWASDLKTFCRFERDVLKLQHDFAWYCCKPEELQLLSPGAQVLHFLDEQVFDDATQFYGAAKPYMTPFRAHISAWDSNYNTVNVYTPEIRDTLDEIINVMFPDYIASDEIVHARQSIENDKQFMQLKLKDCNVKLHAQRTAIRTKELEVQKTAVLAQKQAVYDAGIAKKNEVKAKLRAEQDADVAWRASKAASAAKRAEKSAATAPWRSARVAAAADGAAAAATTPSLSMRLQ